MKREETFDFHLKWTWHNISRYYNNVASEYGSTMATGNVLLAIDSKNGTPSTKLGPSMGMTSRSLVRSLKNLEERGLISKRQDNKDKRMVHIELTEDGRAMREVAKQAVLDLNEKLYNKLSQDEIESFFKVLNSINQTINHLSETEK